MPQYEIQIPGKGTFEVTSPEPLSDAQAYMAAMRQLEAEPPEPKPQSGLMAAAGQGFRSGVGDVAESLGELTGLEGLSKYGKRQKEQAEKAYVPTSEADIAAASKRGMLPELGAYATQFLEPYAQGAGGIAARYGIPTLASMAAPEAAPLMADVAFAATNAPIHIGEVLKYQKEQGLPQDTQGAITFGLARAAVDSLAGPLLAGPMRGIIGKTAVEEAQLLAPRVASGELSAAQAATMVSGRLKNITQATIQNAAVGTGMMTADEALLRASAGQDVSSPEAIKAYEEQAKGALALAPMFGLLHGFGQPGEAKKVLRGAEAKAPIAEEPTTEADNIPEPTLRGQETAAGTKEAQILKEAISPKKQAAMDKQLAKEQKEFMAQQQALAIQREQEQAEKDRIAALSPEEFATEQMQGLGKTPKVKPVDQDELASLGYQTKPPFVSGEVENYTTRQLALAKDREPYPDNGTYAQYLLTNPNLARQIAMSSQPIPGLTATQSHKVKSTLLSALTLQDQAAAKAAANAQAAKQERGASLLGMSGTQANQELLGATRETPAYQAQAWERAERERVAAKEQAEKDRIAKLTPEEYKAELSQVKQEELPEGEEPPLTNENDPLLNQLVNALPRDNGHIVPGQVYEGMGVSRGTLKDLQLQLAIARMNGNTMVARRLQAELDDQRKTLKEPREVTATGEKSEGLTSVTPEARSKQAEADKFADQQRSIMLGLFKTLNTRNPLNPSQTRRNATLSLPGVFEKRISDAKDAFIAAHTNEIEARRAVFGLPPMAEWERAEARARSLEALNELEKRWNTFGAPVEAVQVLQQQVRDSTNQNLLNAAKRFNKEQTETAREKIGKPGQKYVNYKGEEINVPKQTGPRIAAPSELTFKGKPRIPADDKVAALKFIDSVLDQAERRVRGVPVAGKQAPKRVGSMEDIARLFEEGKAGARTEKLDQASVELLNRLRNHLETSTDPDFISLAREQAQRIMEGNLPDPMAVRDLDEMMKGREVSGRSAGAPLSAEETAAVARGEKKYEAQPQKELFPEAGVQVARATPLNFQKMLDSKDIQGMRDSLVKQKEDNQAVLEQVKKYLPSLQKAMQTATSSLNKALEKKETLTKSAAEAKKEPEWYAPAVRKIVELESALQSIPPRLESLRSIQRAIKGLSAEDRESLLQLADEAKKTPGVSKKDAEDFSEIVKALKNPEAFNAEIKMLNDAVKNAAGLVDNARKTLDDLMAKYEKGAAMRGSIERAAEKATRQVERATENYNEIKRRIAQERVEREAEEKAKLAKPVEEEETSTEEYEAAVQRGREGMGLPGTRVEKDTSRMGQEMHKIRSELGSLNEELRKAENKNDTDRIEELKDKIEDAESRLASVYRDAPLKVKELLTPEEELLHRLAAADRAAAEDAAAAAKSRKRKGEAAPKLVPIEQTALLKEVRGSKITQPYKTARVAEAAEKVTDRLVKQKTELADIQRRIAYLKDNNKHKVAGRLTDTFKDLQGKEALLKEKLNKTKATQRKIVSVEKNAETLANKAAQAEALRKSKASEKEADRFARGVEVESPDLTDTQRSAIEENNITAAYADIAKDSSTSDLNRVVAQRLGELLGDTKIKIQDKLLDKDGKEVLGSATSKQIILNRKSGLTQEILLHEGTHAATERVLTMPEDKLSKIQLTAKRELQALHASIKNDPRITSETAKGSLSEFVAEVMSNRNLQEQLREKKWKLSDAWKGFKSIILRLLGIKDPETMLGAALQSVDALMVPSSMRMGGMERLAKRRLSQKDIAALHDGSNSMKQFADQFGKDIKAKDRTPEDVERIAYEYLSDMNRNAKNYVAAPYTLRDLLRKGAVLTKEQEEGLAKRKALREQLAIDESAYRDGEPYDEDSEHYKEITKQLEKQQREIDQLETKLGSIDYLSDTRMSDGKQFDPENPLHYVEADATTLASFKAQSDGYLRDREALAIRDKRVSDLESLVQSLSGNTSYTLAENALVAKAASKFAVVSDKNGRLKLASIANNNRNGVAIVSLDAADAVIRELRAGKNLKEAFIDGMQASADRAAKENSRKEGWQKFNQAEREETEKDLTKLYTDEEIGEAWMSTGYDIEDSNQLIEQLIADGLLPDRRVKNTAFEKAAIELNKACAGTSWCTGRDENYAREHIAGGDFYVYYKQGRPEVAVRMRGQAEIGEVRGNTLDQALNNEQQKIAEDFLTTSNFKDADKYLSQFRVKQKAIEVAKGEAEFTPEDLLNSKAVRNGKISVENLLSFDLIDGHRSLRGDPEESVKKFFEPKIKKAVEAAYEEGNFIGASISVDEKGLRTPVKLDGKKYNPALDDIKSAETISVGTTRDKVELPNLESVKALLIHGSKDFPTDLYLPKIKYVSQIIAFGDEVDRAVVTLAPNAVVGLVEAPVTHDGHITIKNAAVVKNAESRYGKTLYLKLPDTKYLPFEGNIEADVVVYAPNRIEGAAPIEEMVERPAEEPRYARRVAEYAPGLDKAGALSERLIETKRPLTERLTADAFGRGALEAETRMVDQFAPAAKLSRKMDALNGIQMMHFLRMTGQRMNLLGQAVGFGAPELKKIMRPDGRFEWLYQAKPGANLAEVAEKLSPANELAGSPDAAANLFSLYTIAERAKSVGLNKLNYRVTQAELNQAMDQIRAVPNLEKIFKNAAKSYEKFNRNMVQFGVDTGVFSQEQADKMLSNADYVPYYRENNDGSVSLMMGSEHIVSMGNVKDQPYLHALVGGDQRIADFMTSSVRNANMILDMGLRNQAKKSVANELQNIGLAQIIEGKTRAGTNIVQFKANGKDHFAIIKDSPDVPADLLVKGLEGIPVQTSALLQMAGAPSRWLRTAFVANPVSAGRILFKDTLSSALTSGSGFGGMSKALREVGNNLMERRGISGGEVFTGLPQDLTNILRQIQTGQPGWESLLAKANVLHAKADAMTRQLRYESYRSQGLSEMEATHMALESMNFTRRGISPSIHVLNALHPFMNSQIQGVNTLIKAIRGNMPMEEKLQIRNKIIQRGMLLAGTTMLYSALMQDDDTYKNALPEQKYNNFFVPFPGVDEKVRVPIPFEAGILFKSVPEAIVNYMYGHDKDAAAGMRQAVLKLIPAGESYGVPQILAPGIEVGLGKSFYTGRDIESRHEQTLVPGQRVRDTTSGFAAELGDALNMSPVKIDHFIGGYTGQIGLVVTQMASSLVFGPKMAGADVAKHGSQQPIIGSLLQPNDAGAIVEDAYQMVNEAEQVKNTVNDMIKKGRTADAKAFMEKNATEWAKAQVAPQFTSRMTQINNMIQFVKNAPNLSRDEKLEKIDELKKQRTEYAEYFMQQVNKTIPQSARQ